MTKYVVEANMMPAHCTPFWIEVVPTDGRPWNFDTVADAIEFESELVLAANDTRIKEVAA